jgi:hypothetical protein
LCDFVSFVVDEFRTQPDRLRMANFLELWETEV